MNAIPETMQAVEISEPGGPEVLRPTTRPVPALADGEVLVRVAAAGINRPDVMQRTGNYPPPPGAPDLPGLGESDLPELNYTPENLSAALADGLDRTVPKPFDMAGFSTGGLLGGHAAARLGDKVRSLTLIGASGFGPIRRQTQQLTRAPGDGDTADAEATARRNLGILMFADKANIDELAVHIHMQNLPRARVRSRRMALSDTLLRVLPDVVAPLNGIWGEHDTTLPPNIAERENQLRAIQPGLDFRVIDGAGHWVMYEAADAFNAALLDVLSRRREGST